MVDPGTAASVLQGKSPPTRRTLVERARTGDPHEQPTSIRFSGSVAWRFHNQNDGAATGYLHLEHRNVYSRCERNETAVAFFKELVCFAYKLPGVMYKSYKSYVLSLGRA
jgi:hypothetical protein